VLLLCEEIGVIATRQFLAESRIVQQHCLATALKEKTARKVSTVIVQAVPLHAQPLLSGNQKNHPAPRSTSFFSYNTLDNFTALHPAHLSRYVKV